MKKVNWNWNIINKNGHSTFHTGKPRNFNSLREVVWIILWHCYLETAEDASQCRKSVMVINLLQMICIVRACPWSSWTIPSDIVVVETWEKSCTARLPSKERLQIQSTETSFCICLWSMCHLNFITCFLYFPLVLIRWNSSHCHLMGLPFHSSTQ